MSIVSNSLTRLTHAMPKLPKLPKAFNFSKCGPFGIARIEREAQQARVHSMLHCQLDCQ